MVIVNTTIFPERGKLDIETAYYYNHKMVKI